jgi:predicted DNA-binding transcriptional regulator YafY
MLASRLLSILMRLQTQGRTSAVALAREFEVSVRTIYRDVDQLSAAGVPIYAERGRAGGFELMDGYRTKLTGLTQPEAEAMFLAGLPGPAAQLGLSDLLSAARLKLMAALPAGMAPSAERIASRFHLDPETWFRRAEPLPALKPIAQAVWDERLVQLRYRASGEGEARARTVAPLGLVLKGGVWYLLAESVTSAKTPRPILTYRLAHVVEAEATETRFSRPKSFDLAAHWEASSRAYETGVIRGHAEVRLTPRGVKLLGLLGPQAEAAAAAAGKPDRAGRVVCKLPVEGPDNAVRDLLRLGPEAEVLGPPALREKLKATLAQIARLYRGR